ncbi:hypothetical protein BH11BAC2_BH11BAC2_07270 [soil metagenome]
MRFSNPGAIIENTLREQMLKKYFSSYSGKGTLLDLGCGPRPYYSIYAPYFDKTIGADLADSPFPKQQIDIYCSATAVPLDDASIDVILCTEVLHDIAEPSELIDEAKRLLKPGGTLILTTPFVVPIVDGAYDHYRYTQQGLIYLLQKSALEVKSITPVADIFGATLTLIVKPILKFWNMVAKATGISILYKWYNPILFLTAILPQCIYLWTTDLPLFKSLYRKFNYGPIGYISIATKSK